MKPFEIQSTALSIGGVTIDTSAQGKLVIPGVTRASTSVAIEVEDTGDQSTSWQTTPQVIDGYAYTVNVTQQETAQAGWSAATYEVNELDDDGYIDGINVTSGGSGYTTVPASFCGVMFASEDGTNWIEIPFKVRCGAGEIESEFGGGSGSNTGNITFEGNTISAEEGYPTLVNAVGSAGGVEIDYNSETVSHAMWLNGEDGLAIQINRHLEGDESRWFFGTDGKLTFPDGSKQTSAAAGGTADLGNFTFTNNKITFPDGTEQTTAYVTAVQKGFFLEFKHNIDNERVSIEAVTTDSEGYTYASYSYYSQNDGRRYGGIVKVSSSGAVIWSKDFQSTNSSAEYPQIASLEFANVDGLDVLTAYGYYYDNNTNRDTGFTYFIDPATGENNNSLSLEMSADYAVTLKDGVFGIENGAPMALLVGESYGVNLVKPMTILSPSTVDKVYISWEDYAASGLNPGEQLTYSVGGWYGFTVNRFDVNASPDGTAVWEGLGIQVTVVKDGTNFTYGIIGSNGWGWMVNNWSGVTNLKVLGSKLGGTDGVNDLTFDFDPSIFQNDSSRLLLAITNIQGTPISDSVYCTAWNGKDWSTEIGNTLNFDYQLNRQALLSKLGGNGSWTKNLGSTDYEDFNSVIIDNSNSVYAVGRYWSGSKGSFIIKYDSSGTEQWAVYVDPISSTGNTVNSIDLLSDGNLITVADDGIVTKLSASDGSIIWQIRIDPNNDISWDSDFRGSATPNGDYIFTNYEDNNYTMYVICVNGSDGSIQWAKQISRTWGGNNGEIYPQDDYEAQYIDCGPTNVVIGASSYIYLNGNGTYCGLLYSLPLDGQGIDGAYEQYIIGSASVGWTTETTVSTPATVTTQDVASSTTNGASPNVTNPDLVTSKTNIGGGNEFSTSIANGDYSLTVDADNPRVYIKTSDTNKALIGMRNTDELLIDSINGPVVISANDGTEFKFESNGVFTLPYGGDIRDNNGNSVLSVGSLPRAASPTNIPNPDVSCGIIRVMMNAGVVTILSSEGNSMALVYTGRIITASGTQTIINSSATSVDPGMQHTLGTLTNRGDTLIVDNLYDANYGHIYRITVMVTWSSLPNGSIVIERIA